MCKASVHKNRKKRKLKLERWHRRQPFGISPVARGAQVFRFMRDFARMLWEWVQTMARGISEMYRSCPDVAQALDRLREQSTDKQKAPLGLGSVKAE